MPEIKIIDEITAPAGVLSINYTGANPFAPCAAAPGVLKDIMKIPGKDLFETDVRWDITSDPRDFYGWWMGKRGEDAWTNTKIRLIMQGTQSSKEKIGNINIQIKGTVETSYKFSNFIQRAFWWFYNYGFYYKQRRRYIEFAKDNIYDIKEKMQEILGVVRE